MTNVPAYNFNINIFILRCFGLYHDEKPSRLTKIWSYSLFFSCVLVSLLAFVQVLTEKNKDFTQLTQVLLFAAHGLTGCLKLSSFLIMGPRIKKCMQFFQKRPFVAIDDEEKRILEDCFKVCRRNVHAFGSFMVLVEVGWNFPPLFSEEYRLPMNVWLPYEHASSRLRFYTTYCYIAAGCCSIFFLFSFCA